LKSEQRQRRDANAARAVRRARDQRAAVLRTNKSCPQKVCIDCGERWPLREPRTAPFPDSAATAIAVTVANRNARGLTVEPSIRFVTRGELCWTRHIEKLGSLDALNSRTKRRNSSGVEAVPR
jgi:hypothetical protein